MGVLYGPERPEKEDFSTTEKEYRNKKEEVINRFRKEFTEKFYQYSPEMHAIVELIIKGADPYVIIEQLIQELEKVKDLNLKLYTEGIRLPQTNNKK
jgi:7-keto-8-aminopelargonate synthetase-like enzyme